MKALLLTLGTRGDVQPFVALARALRQAGHDAVLVAPRRFGEFARAHEVPFAGIADGPMALLDNGSPVGDVADGGLRAKLALARRMPGLFTEVLRDCWTVASAEPGVDVIVHNGQVGAGPHVAEKLGVPAVLALPLPLYVPTGAFPWPGLDLPHGLPGPVNRASYLGMRAAGTMFGRVVDRFRADLGLPRRRGRHDPLRRPDGGAATVLHAVSPQVLPRPGDWPATASVTGYWFLHDAEPGSSRLPPGLAEFLDRGDPPVFVGFGSMSGTDPAATTRVVLEAVRRSGRRAVLGTGWGGLDSAQQSKDVFVAREVPYPVLFPRVSAVVHHGGAGTTAAAAAAGRPQVVCPFVADQPFWGRRMARLGVAPPPVHQRRLTAAGLAEAIERTTALVPAAEDLGRRVRAEQGLAVAVRSLAEISR
ncbi:glycosyltransferase [Amycolatopsis silviterrae]|uniref:Glycosyltransferase n=1 Tax=Amycolatopsis silviterrae TaxID=1656914 RepID=A0ABW5HBW5_9PSEU